MHLIEDDLGEAGDFDWLDDDEVILSLERLLERYAEFDEYLRGSVTASKPSDA